MVCDNCGTVLPYAILVGRKRFCDDCYMKVRPPTLILTKHWANNSLFDPNKKSYIGKDLEFFKGCGFRVFNHRIFNNCAASPVFREYITLKYYGNLTCSMVAGYTWPKDRQYCRYMNCYHK